MLLHPDAVRPTSDRERLAFDFLSSAAFVGLADARFMMLMMSLEVLIEQAPRSDVEQEHVDSLLKITRETECLSHSARGTFVSASTGSVVSRSGQPVVG